MTVIKYTEEKIEEWNAFNNSAKKALFMFDRNYMDYHSDRFEDNSLLFYHENKLVALLPANKKNDCLESHGGLTYGGFIFGKNVKQSLALECMYELMVYMEREGFHKLKYKCIPYIFGQQPAEEDQYALFRIGANISKVECSTVVNLEEPLEMSKLRRRMTKRAICEKVEVEEECCKKSYMDYVELLNTVLYKHHGVNAVHTGEELYLLYSRFPNNIHLVVARNMGKMIAGSVLFEYKDVIHTQYLAVSDEGRKIGALDLIISSVIDRYRDTKKWLDFGISTENRGLFLNEGLISQKEGFGGRTVVYNSWEKSI